MVDERARNLIESIYRVTRGDLERCRPARCPAREVLGTAPLFRVRELAVPADRDLRRGTIRAQCAELIGVAHARSRVLRMVVSRRGGRYIVALGMAVVDGKSPDGMTELQSVFPGTRLRAVDVGRLVAEIDGLGDASFLVGVPGRPSESPPFDPADVSETVADRLGRVVGPGDFAFIVVATPVERGAARVYHHELAQEHGRSVVTARLCGTVDQQDHLAAYYGGLVERLLRSAQEGQATGLWDCTIVLCAENRARLDSVGSVAVGGSNLGSDHPVPLRVIPCGGPDGTEPAPRQWLSSTEIVPLLALPTEERAGFRVRPRPSFSVDPEDSPATRSLSLGSILDRGAASGFTLRAPVDALATHALVCGMTGSGKTTTVFHILQQLWVDHRIPFLAIESAKSEYRKLLSAPGMDELRVFTLASEPVAPLRINPFEVPDGCPPQVHIDHLKTLFRASFVLYPPMPEVLEISLTEIFEDRGWDLASGEHRSSRTSPRRFPTLDDLYEKTGEVVDRLGYDERLQTDIRAGLRVRLDSLRLNTGKGMMLNVRTSSRWDEILRVPCVFELHRVVSDEEKAFVIGLVLMRLYEHFEVAAHSSPSAFILKHLTVVEEAHRLLRNVGEGKSDVHANPRAEAVQAFANMLAELRSYGCGLLIAEQIPSKLIPDVVKNTGLKIAHMIVSGEDRRLIGESIGLPAGREGDLLHLRRGEALVRGEGTHEPVQVAVPNAAASLVTVGDARVRAVWSERSARQRVGPPRPKTSSMEQLIRSESYTNLLDRLMVQLGAGSERSLETLAQLERVRGPDRRAVALHSIEDLLAAAGERALERRARRYGWVPEETERLVSSWGELAGSFAARAEGNPSTGRGRVLDAARRFGSLLSATVRREEGPLTACRLCRCRCQYLEEVSMRTGKRTLTAAARALAAGDSGSVRAEIRQLTYDLLGEESPVLAGQVAMCFTVSLTDALVGGVTRRVAIAKALIGELEEEMRS